MSDELYISFLFPPSDYVSGISVSKRIIENQKKVDVLQADFKSNNQELSQLLDKFIDKAPMNIKLSTNSIAQNPRRFAVSTFSIFAAFTMIMVTGLFHTSKDELIGQTLNRRLVYIFNYTVLKFVTNLLQTEYIKCYISCQYLI